MSKLIYLHSITAEVKLVRCSQCYTEFPKVPRLAVYGHIYNYCPICGCKVSCEGYSSNKKEET